MTAQTPERIIIDELPYMILGEPLAPFIAAHPEFDVGSTHISTACWRGYVGTWEFLGDALHLVYLECNLGWDAPVAPDVLRRCFDLFGVDDFPVPATWFTGRLRIPWGPLLTYTHMGYASVYSRERIVTLERGRIVRDRVVDMRRIAQWRAKRDWRLAALLAGDEVLDDPFAGASLTWVAKEEEPHVYEDWWPAGYVRHGRLMKSAEPPDWAR